MSYHEFKLKTIIVMQVLGPKMIAMIDRALMYKEQYNEFKVKFGDQLNPYEEYKDAEKYLGWRELSVKFTGLFGILNSTKNRLDTNSYNGNLTFLKEFLQWFEAWKLECLDRQSKKIPENSSAYHKMCGFFTAEASDDCMSMVKSIINMTEYYCSKSKNSETPVYFLPRRISQDLVENGFSKIRLAIEHGRLDHKTTANACIKVNLIKEIKSSDRNRKKRNASGCNIENNSNEKREVEITCTDAAVLRMNEARSRKYKAFSENPLLIWKETDGILHL